VKDFIQRTGARRRPPDRLGSLLVSWPATTTQAAGQETSREQGGRPWVHCRPPDQLGSSPASWPAGFVADLLTSWVRCRSPDRQQQRRRLVRRPAANREVDPGFVAGLLTNNNMSGWSGDQPRTGRSPPGSLPVSWPATTK